MWLTKAFICRKALDLIQKAVKLDPKNGDLY